MCKRGSATLSAYVGSYTQTGFVYMSVIFMVCKPDGCRHGCLVCRMLNYMYSRLILTDVSCAIDPVLFVVISFSGCHIVKTELFN